MKVAVTGGTGLIGTEVVRRLRARGDEVTVLTRQRGKGAGFMTWDPSKGIPQVRRLEGLDALVHLTGEPLATRPWTKPRRKILRSSRVMATESLLRSLAKLDQPPKTFIGAGHLGLFGDGGERWLEDDAPRGEGFLADLAAEWETAQLLASEVLGARSAVLRMAIVLSDRGGAFPLMVFPFRHGFGGWLGNGRQYTSWVSLRDAVRALLFLLDTPGLQGGFNGTVPEPVSNREWFQALGRALDKPVKGHAPMWALKGGLGELADAVMLNSCRARPRKLLEAGFSFEDTDVEATYQRLLDALGE